MGDFNIHTTNNINSKLNQLMHQLRLTPLIHSNTRPIYNTNIKLIIDQFYTNIDTNFIGKKWYYTRENNRPSSNICKLK